MSQTITVAHIDKNETFHQLLMLTLKEAGDIKVLHSISTDPQQLDELEKQPPDIIVFDVNLPVEAAIEYWRLLQQRFPAIPKIVYTFHESPFIVRRLMKMEIDGYTLKSGTAQELIEAIRTVHRGSTYYARCKRFVGGRRKLVQFSLLDLQVLRYICLDWSSRQIAKQLNKTVHTITVYRKRLRVKCGVSSLAKLIIYAIAEGLVSYEELEAAARGAL